MTPADIAVENVEALIRGEITEPSEGTLAARVLAWAYTRQEGPWMETAKEFSDGLEFYRGIVWKIGDMFGVDAYTSDDGSIQDSVLALKVPELVSRYVPSVTITVNGCRIEGDGP